MVEIINADKSVEKIIFQGGAFTNSFSSFSIAYSIIKFFNEIHRFETVEDYKDYLITKIDNQAGCTLEDEILNIGRIISLCRKYEELNPVFPYRNKLREWIEARINKLISTNE